MADATYIKGAELNDVALTWNHPVSGLYTDFITDWTFTVFIGTLGGAAAVTKTTGITPAAIAPNILIAWAADELDALPVGEHTAEIEAKHTPTNKDRKTQFTVEILPRVGP
jgi:hypothetical protein